jgi:hypothetical protein
MAETLVNWKRRVSDPMLADIIETLYLEEPIFQFLPMRFIAGVALQYTTEQTLPGVAFRKLNEALPEGTGVVNRPVESLKPFGVDSDTDKVLAKAEPSERIRRDRSAVKAMAIKYVQTLLYGNSPSSRAGSAYNDVDGFDGIQKRLADAGSTNVVDNGGSGGSDSSSVFVLRFGDTYCEGLMQGPAPGITVTNLGEISEKPVFRTRIDANGGFAIYHGRAVAWLKNIRAGTAITRAKLDETIDKLAGEPSVILMSRRTRRQLKDAVFPSGAASSIIGSTLSDAGKVFQTYGNAPVLVSDAIIDTETTG